MRKSSFEKQFWHDSTRVLYRAARVYTFSGKFYQKQHYTTKTSIHQQPTYQKIQHQTAKESKHISPIQIDASPSNIGKVCFSKDQNKETLSAGYISIEVYNIREATIHKQETLAEFIRNQTLTSY